MTIDPAQSTLFSDSRLPQETMISTAKTHALHAYKQLTASKAFYYTASYSPYSLISDFLPGLEQLPTKYKPT
jgi:hypothetical protein